MEGDRAGAPDMEVEEADNAQSSSAKKLAHVWNTYIWHGGSVYDAWLNAVSSQVGQVILSMPYSYAQMGYGLSVFSHLLYAGIGCWTCYLMMCLYMEYRRRKEKEGVVFERHIIQYHEVMGYLVGAWLRRLSLVLNIVTLSGVAIAQIIACASNAYYLNSNLNKRSWALIFGAVSTLTVFLPSFHNLRVWSIIGVLTTTYTAWYLFIAALVHGQIPNVKHSVPQKLETFFTGTTNILFAFGGNAIVVEIMHAMWKPDHYRYVYPAAILYVLTITMPHCLAMYWAFGDQLLTVTNAFAILPPSTFRSVGLVLMIIHQAIAFGLYIMPLNFMWEKLLRVHESRSVLRILARLPVALLLWFIALMFPFLGPLNSLMGAIVMSLSVYIIPTVAFMIVYRGPASLQSVVEETRRVVQRNLLFAMNSIIILVIFIFGFGFGSWASFLNLLQQVSEFGLFDKCYQCPTNTTIVKKYLIK